MYVVEMYPKVVLSNQKSTLYFRIADATAIPEVRLQPMEVYTISHAPDYWSHHGDRYPWMPMSSCGEDLYCVELSFAAEQRYSVRVQVG